MHISQFISQFDFSFQVPKSNGKITVQTCGFCQNGNKECQDYFGANFVNYDFLTNYLICNNCSKLFDDNVRKKCFYGNLKDDFKLIQQNEFANILRNPIFPCILSFSESRQMGRLYKSRINYDQTNFAIECDKYRVILNLDTDVGLMNWLESIYNKYKVSKSWLLDNTIPTSIIVEMGDDYFQYLIKTKDLIKSPRLLLLLAFCNANEEKKQNHQSQNNSL